MKTGALESIGFLLIPQEALAPLLTMAGLLMIVGFRKTAVRIIGFILAMAFLPVFEPLIAGLLDALPGWLTLLLGVFITLQALRFVGELLLGREAWGSFFDGFLLDIVRMLILLPFRGLRTLLRWLIPG